MNRLYLAIVAVFLACVPAFAVQTALPSTYTLTTTEERELTGLQTVSTVASAADRTRFVLLNLRIQNTSPVAVTLSMRIELDDLTSTTEQVLLEPGTQTVQLPVRETNLSVGAHTWEVFVTSTSSAQLNITTASYLLVQGFDVVLDSSTPTFLSLTDTPNSYSGQAGKFVNVNAGTTALEFDPLVAGDIPDLAASKITTGQLALARGGTNADLSATGAANSFLKQSSAGAAVTVGTIADADVPNTITIDLATAATALAANGANCAAGSYPLGVDASGAVESCTVAGSGLPVVDTTSIVKGSVDATKEIRFEVDGLTTATTRVLTPQNADYTLAGTTVALGGTGLTAGTSGGVLGFTAAGTLASSAALGADQVILGGGAGAVPTSSANLTFDDTNFRLRGQNLTTAADGTLNMLQISGTLPAVPTANSYGILFDITGAGTASQLTAALRVSHAAGYTGSSSTHALSVQQSSAGTGNALELTTASGAVGNMGVAGASTGTTTGLNAGVSFLAGNSTSVNAGGLFKATSAVAGSNFGVIGSAAASTEATDLKNVGGAFTLHTALPTVNVSVALLAQNTGTEDIFRGYDDTTLMFRMEDTGEFTSAGVTSIGWTPVNTANQACNTTCTSACVAGLDSAANTFLACTDATSDSCLCAGAS